MNRAVPWLLLGAAVLAAGLGGAYLWRRAGVSQEQQRQASAAASEQAIRDSMRASYLQSVAELVRADSIRSAELAAARERSRQDSLRRVAARQVIDSTRRALAATLSARDSLLAYPQLVASLEAGLAAAGEQVASLQAQLVAGAAVESGLRDQVAAMDRAYRDLAARPPAVIRDSVLVRAPRRTLLGVIPLPRLHIGLRLIGRCAGPLCADAIVGY